MLNTHDTKLIRGPTTPETFRPRFTQVIFQVVRPTSVRSFRFLYGYWPEIGILIDNSQSARFLTLFHDFLIASELPRSVCIAYAHFRPWNEVI